MLFDGIQLSAPTVNKISLLSVGSLNIEHDALVDAESFLAGNQLYTLPIFLSNQLHTLPTTLLPPRISTKTRPGSLRTGQGHTNEAGGKDGMKEPVASLVEQWSSSGPRLGRSR